MQVPSTMIIQKIRPSYWLAFMEVGWGVFTFGQAGMHNVSELYAFRFLVGFFESSFFPYLLFVYGSWYVLTTLTSRQNTKEILRYTKTELGEYIVCLQSAPLTLIYFLSIAKRIAILHMTAPLGSAFSGYLVSSHSTPSLPPLTVYTPASGSLPIA
jgi:ACS family pantothenate transporter-like MFS transporter